MNRLTAVIVGVLLLGCAVESPTEVPFPFTAPSTTDAVASAAPLTISTTLVADPQRTLPPTTTLVPVPTVKLPDTTTIPSTGSDLTFDPSLDDAFRVEIERRVTREWAQWQLGSHMGRCLIANVTSLSPTTKETVIEYGPTEALTELPGEDRNNYLTVWNHCLNTAQPTSGSATSLPARPCPDPLLTVLPVPAESIVGVVPLGHLNAPSHTQPSDHVYFLLPGYDIQKSPSVVLIAPGTATITRLASTSHQEPTRAWTDWRITLEICEGFEILFGHVSTLSDTISQSIDDTPAQTCNQYGGSGTSIRYCSWDLQLTVQAGHELGTVGGVNTPNTALDFNAYDWTMDPLPFIDPTRHSTDMRQVVCPLDWFPTQLRNLLYSRRQGFSGIAADTNVGCGKVFQDVAGTAKGLWYGIEKAAGDQWFDHLALVDDHLRSDHQTISVASTVAEPGYWTFQLTTHGTTNRAFQEVKTGNGIHCYQHFTPDSPGLPIQGIRFLIDVVTDDQLLIELQSGICAESLSFVDPSEYRRN